MNTWENAQYIDDDAKSSCNHNVFSSYWRVIEVYIALNLSMNRSEKIRAAVRSRLSIIRIKSSAKQLPACLSSDLYSIIPYNKITIPELDKITHHLHYFKISLIKSYPRSTVLAELTTKYQTELSFYGLDIFPYLDIIVFHIQSCDQFIVFATHVSPWHDYPPEASNCWLFSYVRPSVLKVSSYCVSPLTLIPGDNSRHSLCPSLCAMRNSSPGLVSIIYYQWSMIKTLIVFLGESGRDYNFC